MCDGENSQNCNQSLGVVIKKGVVCATAKISANNLKKVVVSHLTKELWEVVCLNEQGEYCYSCIRWWLPCTCIIFSKFFEGIILSFVQLVESIFLFRHADWRRRWQKQAQGTPIFLFCKLTAWWERFWSLFYWQCSVRRDPGAFWASRGWLLPAVLTHIPSTLHLCLFTLRTLEISHQSIPIHSISITIYIVSAGNAAMDHG